MKAVYVMTAVLAMTIGVGVLIAAEHEHANAPTTAPTTQSSAPINKNCLVSGDKVDPAVTIQYKDKTIGFCCDDCPAEFKKDPEKYVKNMK